MELVEENARDLLHHSQPATLTALAAKLPPQHAATHLTLQITLAWAAVLLRHPTELRTALSLVSALEEPKSAPGQASSDLMVEASLIRSVESCFADRVRSLDAQLDAVRSRASSLEPWVLCAASNVGAFDALHRFDFDGVREWHEWGIPHFQYVTGALSIVYSHCLAGMAAREQLDMTRAEDHFRTALRLAHTETGEGSSTARLASAALGDFLYERGELEEADRLLDSRAELGLEGGPVNFLLSMYGTGARVKAVRGDVAAAVERLDEGDQLARTLGLPRLSARIALERIRVGLDPGPARAEGRNPTAPNDGIAILTRELEEESAIRALLRDDPRRAAFRAAKLSRSINAGRRPRAALYATLLHANCLASQGRITDAANLLIPALAQCAEARLIRPVLDEGPSLATVIREIQQTRDPRLSGTGQN
ncbi:hypothetical protein [Nocardia salmonicida]|uniref:hypothetical protein n=1 Tax=Nocardia salmonicida TaxID=53431 RepID=UPI0033D4648C